MRRKAGRFLLLAAAVLGWGFQLRPAHGHGGEFILVRCRPELSGEILVSLTVDCARHPQLGSGEAAVEAMRQALRVETAGGSRSLTEFAEPVLTEETQHPTGVPLPEEPGSHAGPSDLKVMSFVWRPEVSEIRFSVPAGFPHDLIFWLDEAARGAGQPVLWNILIGGDVTPPVRLPRAVAAAGPGGEGAVLRFLAGALLLALAGAVVAWRRWRNDFPGNAKPDFPAG